MGIIANSLRPNGTCSLGMGVCVSTNDECNCVWVVRGSVREVLSTSFSNIVPYCSCFYIF